MKEERGRLERGESEFHEVLSSLPAFAAVRPRAPAESIREFSEEDLAQAARKIEERVSEVREAQKEEQSTLRELSAMNEALERLGQEKERDLLIPFREASGRLHSPYHAVGAAFRELYERRGPDEVADREPEAPPAPDTPLSDFLGYATGITAQTHALLGLVRRLLSELKSVEEGQSLRLRETLSEAGVEGVDDLLIQKNETEYRLRKAREERERAEQEFPEVERIELAVEESRNKYDAYDALHGLLAPSKFETYAVENRQQQLLGVASDIFGEITDGSYGFADDFQVMHRPTGQQRHSKTLSGGEKFLASLSLALGLMEIAGRSGGRLEAFFLDEGFGSLDPNALDRALAELGRRSSGGRMVALVSHVPEVADYIRGHGHVLRVRRDETGSSVAHFDDESDSVEGMAFP